MSETTVTGKFAPQIVVSFPLGLRLARVGVRATPEGWMWVLGFQVLATVVDPAPALKSSSSPSTQIAVRRGQSK